MMNLFATSILEAMQAHQNSRKRYGRITRARAWAFMPPCYDELHYAHSFSLTSMPISSHWRRCFNAAEGSVRHRLVPGRCGGLRQPNECTALMRERASLCVMGNHDWAVLGRPGITCGRLSARAPGRALDARAVERRQLRLSWTRKLPVTPVCP